MTRKFPLMDKIQMEFGALEPWPKDVKLYQPYEVEQILLPDNANCLAVQAFLRMCNLEFEVVSRANAEFMSPSGKVPFIKCGAFVISELEPIVQFVNTKGITLTSHLEADQKSDMRAYMSLVHNVLENAEVFLTPIIIDPTSNDKQLYICWCDKETYNAVTKPRNGSVYPWPLNHMQTWSKKSAVLKRLKMMGWYHKNIEQVYQEVENCCQALTDRLEGKDFFFGKRFTEIDALVYGHMYSIVTNLNMYPNPRLTSIFKKHSRLIDHMKLIHNGLMKSDVTVVALEVPAPKPKIQLKKCPPIKDRGEPDRPTHKVKKLSPINIPHNDPSKGDIPSDADEASIGSISDVDTDEVLTSST